jgi:meiotic recombination protein SPO11
MGLSGRKSRITMARRIQLMQLIEEIVLKHVKEIRDEKPPEFMIRNQRDWGNVIFDDLLKVKHIDEASKSAIKFVSKQSQDNFANIVHILGKVYSLLANSDTCTIRELYYQDVKIMQSKSAVDSAIRSICCLLDASPWELGLMSTSKGLVAGSLTMTTDNNEAIRCDIVQGGVQVPQNVHSISSFTSSAKFVLIVEKDAIFQKLLSEGILDRLANCLLITGKGK